MLASEAHSEVSLKPSWQTDKLAEESAQMPMSPEVGTNSDEALVGQAMPNTGRLEGAISHARCDTQPGRRSDAALVLDRQRLVGRAVDPRLRAASRRRLKSSSPFLLFVKRSCGFAAGAALMTLALGAGPDATVRAQGAATIPADRLEHLTAQAKRRRARMVQRRNAVSERAHARMESTMSASTPSRANPPHAFPLQVETRSASKRAGAATAAKAAPATATGDAHVVPLLVAASDSRREGVVRVINHAGRAGEVRIDAYDDAGEQHGPLTLRIGARESVDLTSGDLENGNSDAGLDGATGPPGEGDWRLVLTSNLAIAVAAYVRTSDGFVTSMHDLVAGTEAGHHVTLFNPASNAGQVSRLRLVNPGTETAEVTIEGIDDTGASPGTAVRVSLEGGMSRTLGAVELESGQGEGLTGALGDGNGRWRLLVASERPIEVMSLLSSPVGYLSNLSTAPGATQAVESGATATHVLALFPSAARWTRDGVQGLARVINRTEEAGTVRIDAYDDEGEHYGPLTLAIGAGTTVHFTSGDLEDGNAGAGLTGATGPPGTGDWRLRLRSRLDLEVLAYVRTHDDFLTGIHDVAPRVGAERRIALFNPSGTVGPVSRLRLVNPGTQSAEVTIKGIDDKGASPGDGVRLSLAGGGSRTLGAWELESGRGAGLSGSIGNGSGRWQLVVTANRSIQAMSLLAAPTGQISNLSTAPGGAPQGGPESPQTVAGVFRQQVSGPVVQSKCVNCHVEGGRAGNTRLVFARSTSANHVAANLQVFREILTEVTGAAALILNKIQGVGHGGGVQVAAGTADFTHMERFLELLGQDVSSGNITPRTLFDTVTMAPWRRTLRRAALIFAGRAPTAKEYAAVRSGAVTLRTTIRGLMAGPEFHEFLIRASNDRLLTDRGGDIGRGMVDFVRENYRRAAAAHARGTERAWRDYEDWSNRVRHGVTRAPLELIAHVVENDLPYTEILTADYIMANPQASAAYGASTGFDDPNDMHEFKPSRIVSYFRPGEGFEIEYDPVIGADRVLNPGPLITDYPHAGILNAKVFLERYPTTATNRNRARSRWTYYHFLGLDVEKSASRTTDPEALADTNNPTMHNPACTVCHTILDPIAGAFQNYADEGEYRNEWGGLDSLDGHYKDGWASARETFEITAESRAEQQTVSVRAWLPAGTEMVRIDPYFDPPRPDDSDIWWNMGIEHVAVRDGNGVVVSRLELETIADELDLCGSHEPRHDGTTGMGNTYYAAWFCTQRAPVEIPADGVYDIELIVWVRHQHEDVTNQRRMLDLSAGVYQQGDTWYRDMRAPGFASASAPHPDNSVQWLARQIVADERFAEATVKFWWPAVMGSEVANPPEDEDDADFEGLLLAANAQGADVERLARGFRRGFRGGSAYNLKDLLVEIVLSKWFRADAVEDADSVRGVALRNAGARRLLTPEELDRKTAALTGFQWGRGINSGPGARRLHSELTGNYRLLYGGIDSDGIPERARDITSVMAGVAKRHAAQASCPVVMRELYLLPDAKRRLFAGIDRDVTPASEFSASYEIEAGERKPETLSLRGRLTAGPKTVRLTYHNDYADSNADRNVYLDRLEVRNAAGRIVASRELEELGPSGECNGEAGDHYALWCSGSVEIPIRIPAPGTHIVNVVAWAEQAGDELPRLSIVVESNAESSSGAQAIRRKLVELHDELLGVQVTSRSPDVEDAYRLFVDVWERKREAQDDWFEPWNCGWGWDQFFFDGILDDTLVEYGNDDVGRWQDFDWDHVNDFLDGIDFSDSDHSAQAWVVVLAYLLMDYRYLYL